MTALKVAAFSFATAWMFWAVAMWLLFSFLSELPVSAWPTNIKQAFVISLFAGNLPSLIAALVVERAFAEGEDA